LSGYHNAVFDCALTTGVMIRDVRRISHHGATGQIDAASLSGALEIFTDQVAWYSGMQGR